MSSQGSVQLYQAAVSGSGWQDLLTDTSVRKDINKVAGLPGRRSGLHMACVHGSTELVERLLQIGADPNLTDRWGDSALHKAATSGHVPCVRSLLTHGAHVNLQNSKGETPLHKAIISGKSECVEVLLENGASVNMNTGSGDTPLHLASQGTCLHCLRMLLSYSKASVNQRNKRGKTPMDVATANNQPPIILMLNIYGSKTGNNSPSNERPVPRPNLVPPATAITGSTDHGERSLDQASWPSLPGQERPVKEAPAEPARQRLANTTLELPTGQAKDLKVQVEGDHYRSSVFSRGSRGPPVRGEASGAGSSLTASGGTVLELPSDSIELGVHSAVPHTDVISQLITLEESLPQNTTEMPARDKTSLSVAHKPQPLHTSLLEVNKPTEQAEVHLLPTGNLTERVETADRFTKLSWSDIKVEITVPRLRQDVTIDYKCPGSVGSWSAVSAVYSLRPQNIHSHQPLLLSFPVHSTEHQLELVCSARDPGIGWTQVTNQKAVKLAWLLRADRCYVYLWHLCSLCVVKQLELNVLQQTPSLSMPRQQETERATSSLQPDTGELTRQKQNADIFAAVLKTLMTDVQTEEPSCGHREVVSEETACKEDPPAAQSEVTSCGTHPAETEATEGHTKPSQSPELVTPSVDTGKQAPEQYTLYLYHPATGTLPDNAKVAASEGVPDDSDFVQYLQQHADQVVAVMEQVMQTLGVRCCEGVDTVSLLKLWLGSHQHLGSKDTWRPVAEALQQMDSELAEDLILCYEVYQLKKHKSDVESSLTPEEAQALCHHLYTAQCLPDRLKKQLKMQDNARKMTFLLDKHVLKTGASSKTMSDFKKALYCTRPDLVQMFSLL